MGLAVGSALIVGSLVGAGGVWFWMRYAANQARSSAGTILAKAEAQAGALQRKAEAEAAAYLRRRTEEADQEYQRLLNKHERDLARRRHEIDRRERKVEARQTALDRKFEALERRERELGEAESRLKDTEASAQKAWQDVEALRNDTKRRCEELSGLTQEEAKKMLLEAVEVDLRQEMAAQVRRIEAETKEVAERKARQIVTLAIQRCCAEQVSETSVSVVQLPSDDLKGRIIGREGRNIRALEAATGCNIIIDDTPEAVVLSCFDPLRREVARQALERLISDGRIHPGRIEEVVAKIERDLNDTIRRAGEDVVLELGLADMHPELTKLLGRLRYRTSYGQNVLAHSAEVAHLCAFMASELGADVLAAKRAGLLHDVGKAVSHEVEGTHALIGSDLAKRYHESPSVVHAIAAHHNEIEPRTIVAILVQAADAISAARPGARRETLEHYVKRLKDLEDIAGAFPGVTKAYALQAGRELRIMVEPTEVNDNEACLMAREISQRIEREVQFPGQIKVTVCRELRVVEYAK